MPWHLNPFADPAEIRAAKRDALNRDLTSAECPVCHEAPSAGCDRHSREGDMVLLNRDPVLLAHVARIIAVLALKPQLQRVVLRQFGPGAIPAGLTEMRRSS